MANARIDLEHLTVKILNTYNNPYILSIYPQAKFWSIRPKIKFSRYKVIKSPIYYMLSDYIAESGRIRGCIIVEDYYQIIHLHMQYTWYIWLLFIPGDRKWASVYSAGSDFRDTARFSILPYLAMKPWIKQKLPEVGYGPSFYCWWPNWTYFHSMGTSFRDTDTDILSFYPRAPKLSLVSLYCKRLPRCGPTFKLPYAGVKPGIKKVAYGPSFLGQNAKIINDSTRSGFRDMGRFSKLPYLGMKLDQWQKFEKLHIHYFYAMESKLSLFSIYGQRFPRHTPIFKIVKFGHEI